MSMLWWIIVFVFGPLGLACTLLLVFAVCRAAAIADRRDQQACRPRPCDTPPRLAPARRGCAR